MRQETLALCWTEHSHPFKAVTTHQCRANRHPAAGLTVFNGSSKEMITLIESNGPKYQLNSARLLNVHWASYSNILLKVLFTLDEDTNVT